MSQDDAQRLSRALSGARLPRAAIEPTGGYPVAPALLLRTLADTLTCAAPRLLEPAEIARALNALPLRDRARLLLCLHSPGEDAALPPARHAALSALRPDRDLRRQVEAVLRDGAPGLLSPGSLESLRQGVAVALGGAVPLARLQALQLRGLAAFQQLLAPRGLSTPVDMGAAMLLRRAYRAQVEPLPELAALGPRLRDGSVQALLALPSAEMDRLGHATRAWSDMAPADREAVLGRLLGILAAAAGIAPPRLVIRDFGAGNGPLLAGYYEADPLPSIHLNAASGLANMDATVGLLVHELVHARQDALASAGDASPEAQIYRSNFRHYIGAGDDNEAYRRQPVEAEAFAAQAIATPRLMQVLSLFAHRHDPGMRLSLADQALGSLDRLAAAFPGPQPAAIVLAAEVAVLRQAVHRARMSFDDAAVPRLTEASAALLRRAAPPLLAGLGALDADAARDLSAELARAADRLALCRQVPARLRPRTPQPLPRPLPM